MSDFFSPDSKVMQYGNKLADFILISIYTIVCSLPIITIGASLTAMHYSVYKIYCNEESTVTKDFFKGFKTNFKKATVLWIFLLMLGSLIIGDYWLLSDNNLNVHRLFTVILLVITVYMILILQWIFVLLSRYENTVLKTLCNATVIAIANLGKTLLILILSVVPFVLSYMLTWLLPLIVALGISGCAYVKVFIYDKVFRKLEEPENVGN